MVKKKKAGRKKKSLFKSIGSALSFLFRGLLLFFGAIGSFFIWVFRLVYRPVKRKVRSVSEGPGMLKVKKKPSIKPRVIESFKGDFNSFWRYLNESDSVIGIVVGARGSGKSAFALSLAENLKGSKKKCFAMGFSRKSLPAWITVVEHVDELENDSFVVIDEGGILFSSRDPMGSANRMLSELLFIARHKNLTILFISQNSSNLEVNTLRQADFIVLKKSSLLQKNFERKIVADIYSEFDYGFKDHADVKGLALLYSDRFVGFVENDLPSFWSENVSKSFK